MLDLILLIIAGVLLLIEAFRPSIIPTTVTRPIPNLGWLGLAIFVLTFVLSGAGIK